MLASWIRATWWMMLWASGEVGGKRDEGGAGDG